MAAETAAMRWRGGDLRALVARHQLRSAQIAAVAGVSARRVREILATEYPSDRDVQRVVDAVTELSRSSSEDLA